MTDETTTEQLADASGRDLVRGLVLQVADLIQREEAEIEGQAEDTPATGYTPPEGWRVLAVGEVLLPGDEWVNWEGTVSRPDILHGDGATVSGGRYIRRIKPEPQAEPEPEPVQVREGRWRTRHGDIRNVTPTPAHDSRAERWPWRDAEYDQTWREDGGYHIIGESPSDLVEYLGPLKPQPQQVNDWPSVRDLRHELKTVQTQLGESRQRVTHLEELVTSLRTINETQEKAFTAAGKENTALKNQLAAVKAELASVAADRQQLRVELDAAQQVPADSPELRQLRADLEQMTLGRDTYQDGYNRVLSDLETARETATAETVEAIAEWLQPFRGCNSPALALLLVEALPSIMRSITGLADEEIE